MAGVLECMQKQIQDLSAQTQLQLDQLTKAINNLSEQIAKPKHVDDPTTARDCGYINWGREHDVIKTQRWLPISKLREHIENGLTESEADIVDEFTRFPEDGAYVDISVPEIMIGYKFLTDWYAVHGCGLSEVTNQVHKRASFEEKYKLKWINAKEKVINKVTTTDDSDEAYITENKVAATNSKYINHVNDSENGESTSKINENNILFSNEEKVHRKHETECGTDGTNANNILPKIGCIDDLPHSSNDLLNSTPKSALDIDDAEENLSMYHEINSILMDQNVEGKTEMELFDKIPDMLHEIAQCKFENLVPELRALSLSRKPILRTVVELFVVNSKEIIEEIIKNKVKIFLRDLKAFKIVTIEQFEIIIDILFNQVSQHPDLTSQFSIIFLELIKIDKRFRSSLVNKCQNEFQIYLIDNDLFTTEVDDETYKRYLGIIKLIGEFYNNDLLTTRILDYVLKKLVKEMTDMHLLYVCELLAVVGKKMLNKKSSQLSITKGDIEKIIASKPHKISEHVIRRLRDTVRLSERKWTILPPPKAMEQMQKENDQKQILRKLFHDFGQPLCNLLETYKENFVDSEQNESDDDFCPPKSEKSKIYRKYPVHTLKSLINETYIKIKDPKFMNPIFDKVLVDTSNQENRLLVYQNTKPINNPYIYTKVQEDLTEFEYELAEHNMVKDLEDYELVEIENIIKEDFSERKHFALINHLLDKAVNFQHTPSLSSLMFYLVESNTVSIEIFRKAITELFKMLQTYNMPSLELYRNLTTILVPHIEANKITLSDLHKISNNIIIKGEGNIFLGEVLHRLTERNGKWFVKELWQNSATPKHTFGC